MSTATCKQKDEATYTKKDDIPAFPYLLCRVGQYAASEIAYRGEGPGKETIGVGRLSSRIPLNKAREEREGDGKG